jgi:hypothetical protein
VPGVTVADHIEFEMLMPLGLGMNPNGAFGTWGKKHRIHKGIRGYVAKTAASKLERLGVSAPERRARLQVTVLWPSRQRIVDSDNLVARLKPIFDGMRDAHLLVDDSPAWVEHLPVQQVKSTVAVLTLRVELDYVAG